MLSPHLLMWFAGLVTVASGAQPAAPVPMYRLPVHIVDCAGSPAGRAPAAVIGSLFTGGNCYREYDADRLALTPADQLVLACPCKSNKYSAAMTEYLLGNVRPRPSAKDEDTCAFIVSPPLSNGFDGGIGVGGFDFTVDALSVQGNTYTATTTFWHDDSKQQWGPGPLHMGQMLRLSSPGYGPGGWLRPGQYTFRLISRDLFMSVVPGGRPLYRLISTKTGSTQFTVVDGEPWDVHTWEQAPSNAVIKEQDLTAAAGSEAKPENPESWPRWQPPVFAIRRSDGKGLRPETFEKLRSGSREVQLAFVAQAPGTWKQYAPAAAPMWEATAQGPAAALDAASGLVVARIRGIEWDHRVAAADTAEVTSVEWTAAEAVTVHIGLWRRSQADQRTQIPEMAVPLETRGLSGKLSEIAERLTVTVQWDEL
ncbi:MAG: hypothetical protein NTV94_01820 [Planctomycetota bacterium]|nr:hypothetical protein [Planctomycetota bacterium]